MRELEKSSTTSDSLDGFVLFSYDRKDKLSVLKYASKLSGHTLREFTERFDSLQTSVSTKGKYGTLLEELFFGYDPNNKAEADFNEIGVELKSTKLVNKKTLGWDPGERLILNVINYQNVKKDSFSDVFERKNSELLVIFYRYTKGNLLDRFIDKVVFWTFSPQELAVMREDWQLAENTILDGRAHLLTEGGTRIITWAPKGAGHGKDMRPQPNSSEKARQRAIALKNSYVCKMYRQSLDLKDAMARGVPCRLWDVPDVQNIFDRPWDRNMTFEEAIVDRLSRYVGLRCDEIEELTERLNRSEKGYHAHLANRMLGVRTRRVAELEDYDIQSKIICLKRNTKATESMSFPAFDYRRICFNMGRIELMEMLKKRYLFIVFQMTDGADSDNVSSIFRGAFFWSVPPEVKREARFVYEDTVQQIRNNIYDDFQALSNTYYVHVRPHATNNDDVSMCFDGIARPKKSFWLNADYISTIVNENLEIPILSTRVRESKKIGKRRQL